MTNVLKKNPSTFVGKIVSWADKFNIPALLPVPAKLSIIRHLEACDPNTVASICQTFAESSDYYVRVRTALHPLTPTDIKLKLAIDESWLVRGSMASGAKSLPNEVVDLLRQDHSNSVRCALNSALSPTCIHG